MKPRFTYKGVEIDYWREADLWEGLPHFCGTGDPDDFHYRAKTLKEAMRAIDEYLTELSATEYV